jgi:hypothetical protein
MLFTVLIISKLKKTDPKAEEREVNYHRFFFKKFGVVKGGLISFCISLPAVLTIGFLAWNFDQRIFFTCLGMTLAVAYVNFITWAGLQKNE